MAFKYRNQLKISINNLQNDQIRMLSYILGVSKQEVIIPWDSFEKAHIHLCDNKTIKTKKPIVGF